MLSFEGQHIGFHVVEAGVGPQVHKALVRHFDLGADLLQFHKIRLGDVLCGGVGGELIGARVSGEAGEPRLLHRDLWCP